MKNFSEADMIFTAILGCAGNEVSTEMGKMRQQDCEAAVKVKVGDWIKMFLSRTSKVERVGFPQVTQATRADLERIHTKSEPKALWKQFKKDKSYIINKLNPKWADPPSGHTIDDMLERVRRAAWNDKEAELAPSRVCKDPLPFDETWYPKEWYAFKYFSVPVGKEALASYKISSGNGPAISEEDMQSQYLAEREELRETGGRDIRRALAMSVAGFGLQSPAPQDQRRGILSASPSVPAVADSSSSSVFQAPSPCVLASSPFSAIDASPPSTAPVATAARQVVIPRRPSSSLSTPAGSVPSTTEPPREKRITIDFGVSRKEENIGIALLHLAAVEGGIAAREALNRKRQRLVLANQDTTAIDNEMDEIDDDLILQERKKRLLRNGGNGSQPPQDSLNEEFDN